MWPIRGYEEYSAMEDGRIWSSKRGKFLSTSKDHNGYYRTSIQHNKKSMGVPIHKLVLLAYVGSCPDGMECRHLNGIRTDNHIDNLEWNTHSKNMKDRKKHGTHPKGEQVSTHKLNQKDIKGIRELNHQGCKQKDIATRYNITQSTVSDIINKKIWNQ